MALFYESDDIFSPVRFDNSLVDSSINFGDSLTSAQNVDVSRSSDLNSKRQSSVFSPISDILCMGDNPTRSNLPISPVTTNKNASHNSINLKKHSSDFKEEISEQRKTKIDKSVDVKKDSLYKSNQNTNKESDKGSKLTQQHGPNAKKPMRPTTLSTLKKRSERSYLNSVTEAKKSGKEASLLKNSKSEVQSHSGFSEEESLTANVSQKCVKYENTQQNKSKQCKPVDEKKTFSPLFSTKDKVFEKIHMSTEFDKLRQIMYSQQISYYRELNKIKTAMEYQHLEATHHLCSIIEELVDIHETLKNLVPVDC